MSNVSAEDNACVLCTGHETDPFAEDEDRKKAVDNLFHEDPSGINFDAYEDIPVEATGKDVPDPITSFDQVSQIFGLFVKFAEPGAHHSNFISSLRIDTCP